MDESAPWVNYKEAPAAKQDKRMFSQTNGVQKQVWLAGTMLTSLSRKVIYYILFANCRECSIMVYVSVMTLKVNA